MAARAGAGLGGGGNALCTVEDCRPDTLGTLAGCRPDALGTVVGCRPDVPLLSQYALEEDGSFFALVAPGLTLTDPVYFRAKTMSLTTATIQPKRLLST